MMKLLVKVENININQILDYINNNFIRLVDMKFNVSTCVIQSEKIDISSTIIYTLVFESSKEESLKKLFEEINVMDYCWFK